MDIEAISGPKLSESIRLPIIKESITQVAETGPISIIDDGSTRERLNTWIVKDRVTISARARRRYNEMIAGI